MRQPSRRQAMKLLAGVLPLLGIHLPFVKTMIAVTFLAGLLPVIGNLISNTVIVNRTQVTNVYNNVYVNKTVNVTNITYQNQTVNNAVTATSQASFTSAQPVHRNMVRVDAREVTAAPVAPTGPAVVPQQRSVLGAGAGPISFARASACTSPKKG